MADQRGLAPNEVEALLAAMKAQGRDPATAVSCAPGDGRHKIPGVLGCSQYFSCIMDRKTHSGFDVEGGFQPFKGEAGGFRPHNLIYEIDRNDGSGNIKQDEMACHHFMQCMYRPMQAGRALLESGEPGDDIRIIGTEGDEYLYGYFGKVKDAKPGDPNPEFKNHVENRVCSVYRDPQRSSPDSYSNRIAALRAKRKEAAEGEAAPVRRHQKPETAAPTTPAATVAELEAKLAGAVAAVEPEPGPREPAPAQSRAAAAPPKGGKSP